MQSHGMWEATSQVPSEHTSLGQYHHGEGDQEPVAWVWDSTILPFAPSFPPPVDPLRDDYNFTGNLSSTIASPQDPWGLADLCPSGSLYSAQDALLQAPIATTPPRQPISTEPKKTCPLRYEASLPIMEAENSLIGNAQRELPIIPCYGPQQRGKQSSSRQPARRVDVLIGDKVSSAFHIRSQWV